MVIWFLFGAMCIAVILFILAGWQLATLHKQTRLAWVKLDHHLKYRAELIPAFCLAVSASPALDPDFLYQLPTLKETCRHASLLPQRVEAEKQISRALKKIVTAAHPSDGQTPDDALEQLRESLAKSEYKIQKAKRTYNALARRFNIVASVIPINFIARMFEMESYTYFDFEPTQPD